MEAVMKMTSRVAVVFSGTVGLCVLVVACGSPPSRESAAPKTQAATSQAQQKEYELKGKVLAIDKDAKKVSVDGQDIPGFMSAMTMSYDVKNERLLDNLAPGDQITARLVGQGGDYWLEQITVASKNPGPQPDVKR